MQTPVPFGCGEAQSTLEGSKATRKCTRGSASKLVFLVLGYALTCPLVYPAEAIGSTSTEIIDGLELFIQTDKSVYELGQEAQVVHRLTNLQETAVSFTCSEDPCWNVLVYENNEGLDLYWDLILAGTDVWARNRSFAHVVWTYTLGPGEFVEYNTVWDLTDYEGNLVALGTYEVAGFTPGPAISTSVNVIPEPATLVLLCVPAMFGIIRHRHRAWHRTAGKESAQYGFPKMLL